MVEGRLGKYFEEICLLDQSFVKNSDQKVRDFVKSTGGNIRMNSFVMLLVKVSKNVKTTLLKK